MPDSPSASIPPWFVAVALGLGVFAVALATRGCIKPADQPLGVMGAEKGRFASTQDETLRRAQVQALAYLPTFDKRLDSSEGRKSNFLLRKRFTTLEGSELVWIEHVKREDNQYSGVILESPLTINTLHKGLAATVERHEVVDYAIFSDGTLEGGTTDSTLKSKFAPSSTLASLKTKRAKS